ncbi:hypothetical protein [Mesorhizobium sp. CO1-1-9]|uniref:hypothetical protein n=1 Tax=Mesorhizobium sp. CO1-1-9 TaxID=2876630 RepID=UPI001CCE62E0|nr:hypothetical protein [Mesorhizobium sp. CO1-1-9]MBZ9698827.1 hypothetical protein [Mesorhizobium sp. CO1-1-9]
MTGEPATVTNAALDRLPLFATDLEIAVAIVGKQNASRWKRDVIPVLERKGFPAFDSLHQGRPVVHIKQFYAIYFGVTAGFTMAKPDGVERVWIGKRIETRIDKEERIRATGAEVVERDFGDVTPKQKEAIAEYRAKKRAEYAARKAR